MFRYIKPKPRLVTRSFKNFGHKREPVPMVTTIWHGFLTFTFIGAGIEWKRIAKFLFGDLEEVEETTANATGIERH